MKFPIKFDTVKSGWSIITRIVVPRNHNYPTVKPVLNGHSKIDKTSLEDNGSLMKVESIAECSFGVFCNTFDLHSESIGLENILLGLRFE